MIWKELEDRTFIGTLDKHLEALIDCKMQFVRERQSLIFTKETVREILKHVVQNQHTCMCCTSTLNNRAILHSLWSLIGMIQYLFTYSGFFQFFEIQSILVICASIIYSLWYFRVKPIFEVFKPRFLFSIKVYTFFPNN